MNHLLEMIHDIRLPTLAATMILCLSAGIPQTYAFDPVNDDTDIFLANPALEANRPNVLIYLDNTANWSRNVGGQAIFINEKTALVNVFQNLSDQFNVGLTMFVDDTAALDASGSYIRYAVRQMTQENRSVLADIVNNFDIQDDRSNNSTLASGIVEINRYFAGKQHRQSPLTPKKDVATHTSHPAVAAGLGGHALDAAGTQFNSPIADICQGSYLIYISNGPAGENSSSLAVAEEELASLGYDTSSTIALSPNGQQGNWMDEWAKFMANADINPDLDGSQHTFTYTVEVDPQTTGQGPDMTALLKSAALHGKGQYFAVSSENAGQGIVNALNQIFDEIQAVNSVFASTTLPVSVNVRGTNLNQVYIGVFRPDETKSPRWFGNLKMYQLGFEEATGTLFLADAAGEPAENPDTGFINASSPSFWTHSSTFWDYRSTEENGFGGASDLPDGDLVEKGGAAQLQRDSLATDQSGRKLYTCTTGTISCGPGSSLSNTPFNVTNDAINAASLQLGTQEISTLSGFDTRTVTNLTDTRSVNSLSTASGGIEVLNLDNGVISQSVTTLTTQVTRPLAALTNNPTSKSISSLTHPTTGPPSGRRIVTATVNGHALSSGQVVHISGASPEVYNGSFVISVVDSNRFTYDGGDAITSADTPAGGTPVVTTTSSIARATVNNHGFVSGQNVTLSGVSPGEFNKTFSINVLDTNTFSFSTSTPLPPVTSVDGATATGATRTATAVTSSAHGYTAGELVTIAGATPSGYNGTVEIASVPASNTFTYAVDSNLEDATGTITASQGGTTVTATTDGAHGFSSGDVITISGADPDGYNGSFTISNVTSSSFTYETAEPLPANTGSPVLASGGTSTTVTASVNKHRFGSPGETVNLIIEGASPSTPYNGTVTATIVDANTFTYPTQDSSAPEPATGTITARLASATAFGTVPGHGFGAAGDTITVTILGADNNNYNREDVTATVVDNDTFKYPLLTITAQGPDTGTDITANIKTTTARARAVAHGFTDGSSITIDGASPAAFNGTFTISVTGNDTFTYTLPSPEGDASGTMVASGGSPTGTDVENLVNWVRGQDNFEDENANGVTTDVRASVHGDVLHSRPAVINYNRHNNNDDVYVFYGANDGIFRAVKGGFTQSDATEPLAGQEAWAFIPPEFFGKLQRLRNNEPKISSSNKKPYFADGSIGTFVKDVNGDGTLDAADGDKVWIFISNRRGGRFIYALDVSDPADPKLLWKRTNNDSGWGELGFTWSLPRVTTLNANSGKPVLIFGAGYDQIVEDVPPGDISGMSSTEVNADSATFVRSMGRGIFVVDAETGNILWQAGPSAANPFAGHTFLPVSGMDFAIPSDVSVISDRNGSTINRAYVGDTGGNVWRVDMEDANVGNWTVTKLAAIGDTSGLTGDSTTSDQGGLRKFLFPPDVVHHEDGYDAVLIGTGDREHPFDTNVVNRMYMFKDPGTGTEPVRGTSTDPGETTIVEDGLFDATSNCIQDSDACNTDEGETPAFALADLESADGWLVTLGEGEKVVGNAVTLNNITFFNTNQPSDSSPLGSCTSNLGIARQYKIRFDDATAFQDQNLDGYTDAEDRFTIHAGGGYLPSPVPVVVQIDGQIHEGVISGVAVDEPPGAALNARLRKFWYKEIE